MNGLEQLAEAFLAGIHTPLLQGFCIALLTFVAEDPTTVATGLLVLKGVVSYQTGFVGLVAGIALGDLMLYLIGRAAARSQHFPRWLSVRKTHKAEHWIHRSLPWAIIVSRFIPGMRLPTYVAAGLLRVRPAIFIGLVVPLSIVWTALLLELVHRFGTFAMNQMGHVGWWIVATVCVVFFTVQFVAARKKVR